MRTFLSSKSVLSSVAKLAALTKSYEQVSARIEANRLLRIPRGYIGGGVRFDRISVAGTVPKEMLREIAQEPYKQGIAENDWRADFHLWQWGLERLQTDLLLHFAIGAANVGRSDAAFEPELRRLLTTEGAKDEVVTSMISIAKKQGNWFMR